MPNDLSNLPLRRGAILVIGGPSAHTVAKRLAHHARQKWRRLKVTIGTPERTPDPKALSLIIPSMSRELNRWLDRDGISGVVNALDASRFYFISALTGETSQHVLPSLPCAVSELLEQMGY